MCFTHTQKYATSEGKAKERKVSAFVAEKQTTKTRDGLSMSVLYVTQRKNSVNILTRISIMRKAGMVLVILIHSVSSTETKNSLNILTQICNCNPYIALP